MQPQAAVLWGFGTVGANVMVTLGENTYTDNVVENLKKIGIWKITLKPQPPGGPHTILASQDVWICSGQSNMEFTVSMVRFLTYAKIFVKYLTVEL